jgi:murein L,D-transpeptidase YafK
MSKRWCAVLAIWFGVTGNLYATEREGVWLLVDTRSDRLTVMGVQGPLEVFEPIALGARGAGLKQRRGDDVTPLGSFRVAWVNPDSRFSLFIGLDYPNLEYAHIALRQGRIDQPTFERIRGALAAGRTPPQDTPLGGQIGIHGIGGGDPLIHRAGFDWTKGCIAVNDVQIHRLASWIGPGTRVEVR